MNLVIDIGNTNIKAAHFKDGQLQNYFIVENTALLLQLVQEFKGNIIFSNVRKKNLSQELINAHPTILNLSLDLKLPIEIDYKTPETLGLDRIAACCGVLSVINKPSLVVDIGTCITLDVLDDNKTFVGGNISPGPELRFKAMNNFTAGLPLEELNNESKLVGKSTSEALQAGVLNGIVFEIEGFFNALKKQNENYQLVLTGGYTTFFDSKLKGDIFAEPNLVLKGLNCILDYNVKK